MSVADVAQNPIREESVHSRGVFNGRPGCSSSELILMYLTAAGSVIPIRVSESDSIASVKLRIQTCNKVCVAKKQKLVLGDTVLTQNNSLIREYNATVGNVLHLVLQLSDLLLITIRTVCGKEFEFPVDPFRNFGYLKHWIAKKGKSFFDVDDQEIFCYGEKLHKDHDIYKKNDAVIHLLVQKSAKIGAKPFQKDYELSVVATNSNERRDEEEEDQSEELEVLAREPLALDFWLEPFVNPQVKLPWFIWDLINSTFDGLERGYQPIRSPEGSGGTYFMQDSSGSEYVTVFKPIDEEPMAVNSPQGRLPASTNGEGLKRGTRIGEGALREVAAYILDHPRTGTRNVSYKEMGFAGVPPSIMVRCLHRGFNHPEGFECAPKNVKIGSLQKFMKNCGSCEDMGPRAFPVEEVHKISVFDIRMANTDRHAGNILVSRGEEDGRIVLIPIDHGYCLPESFEDCTFDWLNWPQSHQPYAPDTIDYIKSLNAENDIAVLKLYGWELSPECARTFSISTMLLKKGAERGLTPFAIGSIMCRETLKKESIIEEIVHQDQDSLLPGTSEAAFLEAVSQNMDSRLDKLVK